MRVITTSSLKEALVEFKLRGDEHWAQRSEIDDMVGNAVDRIISDNQLITERDEMSDEDLDDILGEM